MYVYPFKPTPVVLIRVPSVVVLILQYPAVFTLIPIVYQPMMLVVISYLYSFVYPMGNNVIMMVHA